MGTQEDQLKRPTMKELAKVPGMPVEAAAGVAVEEAADRPRLAKPQCPTCGKSDSLRVLGHSIGKDGGRRSRYHCRGAGGCGFAGVIDVPIIPVHAPSPEPPSLREQIAPDAPPRGRPGRKPKAVPGPSDATAPGIPQGVVLSGSAPDDELPPGVVLNGRDEE